MQGRNQTGRAAAAVAIACILAAARAGATDAPTGLWRTVAAGENPDDGGYVRVLVFRGGLLGRLGHNHVVTHREVSGCARVAEPLADSRIRLALPVAAFVVDEESERRAAGEDFPVPVPADDVAATRRNMLGPRLLDAANHEDILLESRAVSGSLPSLEIDFDVRIAGRERRLTLPATVSYDGAGMTVAGTHRVTHAELGLTPFSAALGTLRVADELLLRFELEFERAAGEAGSDCERALAVVDNDRVALAGDDAE